MHRYWQAANYLTVGQIYLAENPLLTQPLNADHIKRRLLGHWGTSPGLNFIYVHLNRLIKEHDLNVIYISGPGHGGPGMNAPRGSKACTSKSIPKSPGAAESGRCSVSSPRPAACRAIGPPPNSMHEGGELGYALLHAQGAAFDNPDLIVACVIGDGEAETGPAGRKLEREPVSESGSRRRRAADPASERLQDFRADGRGPDRR